MKTLNNHKKNIKIARSENDPNAKPMSLWQKERISLKEGWNNSKTSDKALYILLIFGTLYYNYRSYNLLDSRLNVLTWFGYSSATISSLSYCIGTFGIMCYLVYRDLVNRSVSRRKLFIPIIFYLANYFMINGFLGNF
jgi:hypothetical protein